MLGHATTFAYDLGNDLLYQIDRNGRKRQFTTDALGRVVTETWFDALGGAAGTITRRAT